MYFHLTTYLNFKHYSTSHLRIVTPLLIKETYIRTLSAHSRKVIERKMSKKIQTFTVLFIDPVFTAESHLIWICFISHVCSRLIASQNIPYMYT